MIRVGVGALGRNDGWTVGAIAPEASIDGGDTVSSVGVLAVGTMFGRGVSKKDGVKGGMLASCRCWLGWEAPPLTAPNKIRTSARENPAITRKSSRRRMIIKDRFCLKSNIDVRVMDASPFPFRITFCG